jgi:hypothetical protein
MPGVVFIFPAFAKELFKQPAGFSLLLSLGLLGAALLIARGLRGQLSPAHQFALLAGSQGAWIVLGLLAPLDNGFLPDDSATLPWLAGLALTGLLGLRRLLLSRLRQSQPTVEPPAPPSLALRSSGLSQPV